MVQLEKEGVACRIVAAIRQRIHGGEYRPGDRLPSSRVLAAEWGVSRTTVTAAYGQLIAEGYLVSRPGARAVVARGLAQRPAPEAAPPSGARPLSGFARRLLAFPAPAETAQHRVADFRYGDLASADFPVLAWRRALSRACLSRTERLCYGDPQGSPALRSALRSYLWRARGIDCAPDQIVVVNGSQQGLDLCARILLDPGDGFVIEDPGYVLARHAFAASGGVAVPVPVDREGIRTDALPVARLAYVTPSHQFPLGAVLSAARRRALLGWAAGTGAVVVEDDYDGEYRHGVAPIPPLRASAPESVIYLGTVSKTLSPGLRLGYLVVPRDLVRAFAAAKRLTDRHTPLVVQEALADVLASGAYERHVRAIRRRNAQRREILLQALAAECGGRISVTGAEAGLHVVAWLNGVPAEREGAIVAAARAAGIGLYAIAPLYAAETARPAGAGLVIGYAGLQDEAIRRGAAGLSRVLAAAGQDKAVFAGTGIPSAGRSCKTGAGDARGKGVRPMSVSALFDAAVPQQAGPSARLTIRRPDDWHVHLRDGAMLEAVLPFTAAQFKRGIVMPNLVPPVTTVAMAQAYRARILAARGEGSDFAPLMTCYLTDATEPDEIERGFRDGVWVAAKLYPSGATTNSHHGVTDIRGLAPVFERMEKIGMPALIHGETTDPAVDIFDREAVFMEAEMLPLLKRHPGLKVVIEHVTTAETADLVRAHAGRAAGTVTPHHLVINRTSLFQGGLRPHLYCLPVAKRERHRLALRKAVTAGDGTFFIGTDTAPHLRAAKQAECCSAGVFAGATALQTYVQVFDEEGALDRFEAFASENGPRFYGLPLNAGTVTLEKRPCRVPAAIAVGEEDVVVFRGGEELPWSLGEVAP